MQCAGSASMWFNMFLHPSSTLCNAHAELLITALERSGRSGSGAARWQRPSPAAPDAAALHLSPSVADTRWRRCTWGGLLVILSTRWLRSWVSSKSSKAINRACRDAWWVVGVCVCVCVVVVVWGGVAAFGDISCFWRQHSAHFVTKRLWWIELIFLFTVSSEEETWCFFLIYFQVKWNTNLLKYLFDFCSAVVNLQ